MGTRRLELVVKEKTQLLRLNEERLKEAQKIALVGNWEWDIKTGEIWWSDQVYRLFELDAESVQPDYDLFLSYIHPDDKGRVEKAVDRALSAKSGYSIGHRILLASGSELQVLENGHLELDEAGNPSVMKGTVQDVSAQKAAEQRLSDVIWATGVGVWEWDVQHDKLHANDLWANLIGYEVSELQPLSMLSWEALICPEDLPCFREQFERVVYNKETIIHTEVRLRHRDGYWVWMLIKGRSVEKGVDGHSLKVSGSCADITVRKDSEEKVRKLATFDTLTGVFNRAVFDERLHDVFSLSERTRQSFALLILDLDGFKPVNDQYGHPVGDTLLKLVAADLKSECRESDIVARIGGDEFALILRSANDKKGLEIFARRLLDTISQEHVIDGHVIKVHASMGCCLYDASVSSIDEMIKGADAAMYSAKEQGKNTIKFCG